MPARVAQHVESRHLNTSGVVVPILISAIANVVLGLAWLGVTFGCAFPVSIALWVLCIFEFMLYARADRLPPAQLAAKAHTLGILEIIAGLFNLVSLVCGIIVLINASKLKTPSRV